MKINNLLILMILSALVFAGQADHLILNKVITYPDEAEMIEFYNPTAVDISLTNYYITDATTHGGNYFNLPSGEDFWGGFGLDFIAKFPEMTIESGETLSISLVTSEEYYSYFGYYPDLSLQENFLSASESESTIGVASQLKDTEGCLILFFWDGESDLVKDVDYFLWGNTTYGVAKTTDDGYPFNDTTLENQLPIRAYSNSDIVDSMYVRVGFDEIGETQENGNGITGHDEMSEDFTQSWEIVQQFEVVYGCTDSDASNFNPEATIDDESCEYLILINDIVYNCADELGEQLECDGQYDLSVSSAEGCPLYEESITTTGIVVDYFDITPYNGPHSFSIRGSSGKQIDFVVWPESSQYQDGFDITQTDLYVLADASTFGSYEVKITGELGAYCDDDELLDINSEWQITVEYEVDIEIIAQYNVEDFGCTDENAGNYDPTALIDDGSCEYFPETLSFSVEPYPFVPSIGETIKYTYAVPNGHRCVIRIFDVSGRFITSLLDGVPEFSEEDEVKTEYWDGRTHLGELVPPGTYLMHLEATEFSTGESSTAIAPVVIGVSTK